MRFTGVGLQAADSWERVTSHLHPLLPPPAKQTNKHLDRKRNREIERKRKCGREETEDNEV